MQGNSGILWSNRKVIFAKMYNVVIQCIDARARHSLIVFYCKL